MSNTNNVMTLEVDDLFNETDSNIDQKVVEIKSSVTRSACIEQRTHRTQQTHNTHVPQFVMKYHPHPCKNIMYFFTRIIYLVRSRRFLQQMSPCRRCWTAKGVRDPGGERLQGSQGPLSKFCCRGRWHRSHGRSDLHAGTSASVAQETIP